MCDRCTYVGCFCIDIAWCKCNQTDRFQIKKTEPRCESSPVCFHLRVRDKSSEALMVITNGNIADQTLDDLPTQQLLL